MEQKRREGKQRFQKREGQAGASGGSLKNGMLEQRINLVFDSEFYVSSQSSGIQFYFYLLKYKQIKTIIYIYHIKIQNIIFLILICAIF